MENEHHNAIKGPPTRGIPSKESIWFDDVKKFREQWKYHQSVRVEIDQILQLIFPEKYQKKYFEVALSFMKLLLKEIEVSGEMIGLFLKENNFSKATFYNVVLPRLKKVGMILVERERYGKREKQLYYKKIVKLSKQFSIFWKKIADEYESIVETAKARSKTNIKNFRKLFRD